MSLQRAAVPEDLLDLIKRLMQAPAVTDFFLVGGTALALQLGHRQSMDCDLFTTTAFDATALAHTLHTNYSMAEATVSKNSITARIEGIKADFIAHRYLMLEPVSTIEGIRMAGLVDIAAMKLNAIANRGSKKDFWDLHALMKHLSFDTIRHAFTEKYPYASRWGLEKSLAYFDDAENEPDPLTLDAVEWSQVKADILAQIRF